MATRSKAEKEAQYRAIYGASHVPNIQKGVYQIGGTVTGRLPYNPSPQPWRQSHIVVQPDGAVLDIDFKDAEMRMAQSMFGGEMCGDCIRVKLRQEHDPATQDRRVCPLCETVWHGAEPGNRRREAVLETRRRREGLG